MSNDDIEKFFKAARFWAYFHKVKIKQDKWKAGDLFVGKVTKIAHIREKRELEF